MPGIKAQHSKKVEPKTQHRNKVELVMLSAKGSWVCYLPKGVLGRVSSPQERGGYVILVMLSGYVICQMEFVGKGALTAGARCCDSLPPASERLTQTPQQSHPVSPLHEPLHGELNAIRKQKCFLCSRFYGRACRWAMLGEIIT